MRFVMRIGPTNRTPTGTPARLVKMAEEVGFVYTRYADDLTFSASGDNLRNICNVLGRSESIVTHEGFALNPQKTRVLRPSRQQEVTGVVVNEKLNVSRKTLKRFRATLYQIEKDGPDGKTWGQSPDVIASVQGFANFVYMVNPEKGAALQAQVRDIINKYGWQPPRVERRQPATGTTPPPTDSETDDNKSEKKWWRLW